MPVKPHLTSQIYNFRKIVCPHCRACWRYKYFTTFMANIRCPRCQTAARPEDWGQPADLDRFIGTPIDYRKEDSHG